MEPAQENSEKKQSRAQFFKELFKLVILAILIVVPFREFVARPFIVDGSSMDPTFKNGQYLIVDEVTYHFRAPERGEVIIFKYPKDPCVPVFKQILEQKRSSCRKFIKRVVGLPGETVSIQNGKVTIKNEDNPRGFALDESYVKLPKADTVDYIVAEDEYFVMGDNRAASADSRIWGGVHQEEIVGRPMLRLYPPAIWPGHLEDEVNNNNP